MSESFWKKEISLGRKPKEEQQQAPVDDQAAELEAIKAAAVAAVTPQPAAPEPVAEAPTEAKVPFWKKELGKPKRVKAERPKKQKQPKQSKQQAKQPGGDEGEVPFWKKEISLGKRPARKPARKPERKPERAKRAFKLELPHLALPALGGKRGSKQVPKKLVGLKLGASQIAAARVSNNGAAELVLAVREDLEPGIVVGGELRDPEKLSDSLRDFFRKHDLPKRNVRLGIANNRIGVRTFEIAGIEDPKQLENAIRFRAQEALPIPIEDAVLDYQVLSETKDADGQTVKRVLLVVAYRELVDRYVNACRKAGIELVGIDLEAFALLRAMSAPRDVTLAEDAAVVVVSIGHERSTFAVSDGRVCEFTRVLEWGGWALNVALARALDRAPSEVEGVKRALDLNATVVPDGMTAAQFEAVRDAARRQIQSFARELVSSLQFYQNQPGSLGIAELVLTGGTAHLAGLPEELQRLIGVAVRVGDPLMRVRVGKKAVEDDEQVGSLAIAIGLGIED